MRRVRCGGGFALIQPVPVPIDKGNHAVRQREKPLRDMTGIAGFLVGRPERRRLGGFLGFDLVAAGGLNPI